MKRAAHAVMLAGLTLLGTPAASVAGPRVAVASKAFTESVILAELLAQLARDAGAEATHRRELGGTRILWSALLRGEIDAYPEYTGTLRREILAQRNLHDDTELRRALEEQGLRLGVSLGFDDGYALGVKQALAERLGLRAISDLRRHPELRFGLTHEFLERADGWPALRERYRLAPRELRGLDHDLAYRGLEAGTLDVTDLYSTDADIEYYGLRVLEDDLHVFPAYAAVIVWRAELEQRAPEVVARWRALEGRIDAAEMRAQNARAKQGRVSEERVAADFLARELGVGAALGEEVPVARLLRHTREHLALVAVSLAASIVVALPLGVLAARRARLGQLILAASGMLQTIPSLALLVFMIPLLGIGAPPAIAALFLYGLLPIVRNTHAGLHDVPLSLREAAEALGLPPRARLLRIELPLASRSILAGVKTSAVINVGTATLGALVGAGGYGQPILSGIRLDDMGLILQGALPAAVLALAVQGVFELAERALVPKGLRLRREP